MLTIWSVKLKKGVSKKRKNLERDSFYLKGIRINVLGFYHECRSLIGYTLLAGVLSRMLLSDWLRYSLSVLL